MQLDDLLQRYFASTDLSLVAPDTLASGIEQCLVDLGLEQDRGKRFALWSFLHMLGSAPDLDVAFEWEQDRKAARNFIDLLAASDGERGASLQHSAVGSGLSEFRTKNGPSVLESLGRPLPNGFAIQL